mmetsp:Transcript_34757/g.51030  ORF Transcript_34757/g.51030 Transcript_34757/m.51030 type:complete len:99 (+) Transcript_34757:161-457(+)
MALINISFFSKLTMTMNSTINCNKELVRKPGVFRIIFENMTSTYWCPTYTLKHVKTSKFTMCPKLIAVTFMMLVPLHTLFGQKKSLGEPWIQEVSKFG